MMIMILFDPSSASDFIGIYVFYLRALLHHRAGSDTILVQIYMDAPPGVPGVSKDAPGPT